MPRNEAEKKYGMAIYQGGAVPGKLLRIVEIPGIDVECCGGTHLHNTGDAGKIKILKASKIQDGVVRLEFVAGPAAERLDQSESTVLVNLANTLAVKKEELPARVEELFTKWKKSKKLLEKVEKGTPPTKDDMKELELSVREKFAGKSEGEIIAQLAQILKTQEEHIVKTATRFLQELEQNKKKLKGIL